MGHTPIVFVEFPELYPPVAFGLWFTMFIFARSQPYLLALDAIVLIVFLASVSTAVSQSTHLFVRRLSPHRFLLALAGFVLHQLIEYGLWVATLWVAGRFFGDPAFAPIVVASAIAQIYTPRLFSFFTLMPFFGKFIAWIIGVWTVVLFLYTMRTGLSMTPIEAVATGLSGWLLVQVWRQCSRRVFSAGAWRWAPCQHGTAHNVAHNVEPGAGLNAAVPTHQSSPPSTLQPQPSTHEFREKHPHV